MAIYSCSASSVGRSTHAAGTAGAHLLYIGRAQSTSLTEAAHIPTNPRAARRWMNRLEREVRKNARLCTKIRTALPRELSHQQNADLQRDFVMRITANRVPYYYTMHDRGKDRHNPHGHFVIIDRDIETGRRVLLLSDSPRDRAKAGLVPNGVEWLREIWEDCVNLALERAGLEARIDRRSLVAQGIDRIPTIHIGPRACHIDRNVGRPQSKVVPSPTPRHPERVIDYPMIDAGRTRLERNAEIIDFNLEKAARSPDFETRLWAQFEREQRAIDRPVEAQRVTAARRRTLEERRLRSRFKAQLREVRGKRHAEAALVRGWINQRLAPEIASLKARHDAECVNLHRQQTRLTAIFMTAIDLTGQTRRKRAAALRALARRHNRERAALTAHVRQTRAMQAEAVRVRYLPEIDTIKQSRRQQVAGMKERHHDDMQHEDEALQLREADREQARESLKQQIDAWKKSPPEPADRQTAVTSRLGADWTAKDKPAGEVKSGPRRPDEDEGPSPAPDRPRPTQPQ